MATDQLILAAADMDPALLAALRSAVPEQVGDDLVFRLGDGRVFFVDGFFAADETGDGQPPLPDAIALSRDVADLLLAPTDVDTAAGSETPPVPESGGAGFIPFDGGSAQGGPSLAGRTAPKDSGFGDTEDGSRLGSGPIKRPRHVDLDADDAALPVGSTTVFQRFGGGGLAPTGAISMSAGALASPTFAYALNLRDLVNIHQLTDPTYDGRFPGLIHLLPIGTAYDFDALKATFAPAADPSTGPALFDYYKLLQKEFVDYVDGRDVWMGLAETNGMHRNTSPNGGSEHLFSGDNVLIGTSTAGHPDNIDVLYGYDGNDVIIAYDGQNYLDGGAGNDIFIVTQPVTAANIGNGAYPPLHQITGGDGYDTLVIQLMDGGYIIDPRLYPSQITSIEALTIAVYDESNVPAFIVTDTRGFALESYPPVILLDAAVIANWGGILTVNAAVGRVHLADVDGWIRLPDDSTKPGYTLYASQHNGQTVSLAIANTLEQPIADFLQGTNGNDQFVWTMRSTGEYDGGAGDDTITSKLTPYITNPPSQGSFDLVGPDTPIFRNIEIVQLVAGDQMSLSAAAVAAVTDARNTLWVTSDFAIEQLPAAGKLLMTDLDAWSSLGYVSLITDKSGAAPVHRTGALFTANTGGETVMLFVSAGIELPLSLDTTHLNTWSIWYDGVVALPPPGFAADLDLIDFGTGAQSKSFTFSLDEARNFAGADGKISIVTDDLYDVVSFADPAHWTLNSVERGADGAPDFYIYKGHDGVGSDVTLRVQTDIIEPLAGLHPTTGDDILRVSESIPLNLDGGDGFDRLHILGKSSDFLGLIDLAAMDTQGPSHIELIDLNNGAGSRLQLDVGAVARLSGSDVLFIVGDRDGDIADQVYFQDSALWTRTGVMSSPNAAGVDCIRYEADAVVNGSPVHLTVAIASDLIQPIG